MLFFFFSEFFGVGSISGDGAPPLLMFGLEELNQLSHLGSGHIGGEVFLRDPSLYLSDFQRKSWENSKQLGWQAQPETELGTSRLLVLKAESLSHW